jgi:glycosyltransferase involved in cell wall biosynthesis
MDLSIVIPCLNEAETLRTVVLKAQGSIQRSGLRGEIVVADNGSVDGSQEIAKKCGARVVNVPIRGYGSALTQGILEAQGRFIVMGDADDSYDFEQLTLFISKLEAGYDLVMGNRFLGGIEKGAMPWLHKYLGNPVLSWLGRLFFKIPVGDFHCGLRAFRRDSILSLSLKSTGMEYASEMIVKAALNRMKITEVPTTLRPDGRSRAPHLRTWRDGWRHLVFLLATSPRWLFLYPGLTFAFLGFVGISFTAWGEVAIGQLRFGTNTFLFSIAIALVGIQTILNAILVRVFSTRFGILPASKNVSRFERIFSLERGVLLGSMLVTTSIIGFAWLFTNWTGSEFSNLSVEAALRISGVVLLLGLSGFQILFASFFASILQV